MSEKPAPEPEIEKPYNADSDEASTAPDNTMDVDGGHMVVDGDYVMVDKDNNAVEGKGNGLADDPGKS